MDSYVDAMDDSVRAYCGKLSNLGVDQPVSVINNLTNQLTLEVMLKTVFGDRSFDLISVNGDHKIFRCFMNIRKFENFLNIIIAYVSAWFQLQADAYCNRAISTTSPYRSVCWKVHPTHKSHVRCIQSP